MHIMYEPGMRPPATLSPEELSKAQQQQLTIEKDNNFNLQRVEVLPASIYYGKMEASVRKVKKQNKS